MQRTTVQGEFACKTIVIEGSRNLLYSVPPYEGIYASGHKRH